MDELDMIEISMEIEDEFNMYPIPDKVFDKFKRVEDIVNYVCEKKDIDDYFMFYDISRRFELMDL